MNLKEPVEVSSFGTVRPKNGQNPRTPYAHQRDAIAALNQLNKKPEFATLVVLPTGAGKTYTASTWLLQNALDRGKKVLWLAHRHTLLDQAAASFQEFAFRASMPNATSFKYRIVSGAPDHDRPVNIEADDDLLIVSKDSVGRSLDRLDPWLAGEKEVYVVVDEAHHSIAKTYRKVLDYVQGKIPHVKLIGLTATPFRTADKEKGLLAKVYPDDIAYQIGLKKLIAMGILAKPIFEECYTDEDYGVSLGMDALNKIQQFDILPEDISSEMAASAARNKLIVDRYLEKKNEYGQSIVFAVNIVHATQLAKLFNDAGIDADFVVSGIRDMNTGVSISPKENQEKIQKFRDGKLQVLVNVNILTEGVDLPDAKTVFLTRPTVSPVLMTQMIGRALRGPSAGGTSEAHIVSFVDNWNEHIAWANPESLLHNNDEFEETPAQRVSHYLRLIAISKIEEFAALLNENIDTSALEDVPFMQRIPLGMYAFTYLEDSGMDRSQQVMVYDSTADAYREFIESLPVLFDHFVTEDSDFLPQDVLESMEQYCQDTFFSEDMIPPYEPQDITAILKYYFQYGVSPNFYTFDEIDRNRLDVAAIAKEIRDKDMRQSEQDAYLNELWENGEENLLRLFFGRRAYFERQVAIEISKLRFPSPDSSTSVTPGKRELCDLPLNKIEELDPEYGEELRTRTFEKSRNTDGLYECAHCGKTGNTRRGFEVDHITPMSLGGKTVPENLQVLCSSCNRRKRDEFIG